MTNNIKRGFGMLTAIAMGLALTPSQASARSTQLIKFNLPKTTTVKGVKMPAGPYTVTDLGLWSGIPVLQIRSDETNRQVIAFAYMAYSPEYQASDKTVATFRYDGSAYRLQSIRIAGSNMSYQLSPMVEKD